MIFKKRGKERGITVQLSTGKALASSGTKGRWMVAWPYLCPSSQYGMRGAGREDGHVCFRLASGRGACPTPGDPSQKGSVLVYPSLSTPGNPSLGSSKGPRTPRCAVRSPFARRQVWSWLSGPGRHAVSCQRPVTPFTWGCGPRPTASSAV